MKKLIVIAAVALFVVACNNNNDNKASNSSDPNRVQPESEAVPDSLKIVNDSTVVPDSKPGKPTNGTK